MRVKDYISQLRVSAPLSESPLAAALRWWSAQDEYGGFQVVARQLFDFLWTPGKLVNAPHRVDENKSFSVFPGKNDQWRFNDFATSQNGTLIDFVMLSGKSRREACLWIMDHGWRFKAEAIKSHSDYKISWRPYKLTKEELEWQNERATELWNNKDACRAIAKSRKWKMETIEVLAGQRFMGIYGSRLFYLYRTGHKERLRPLQKTKAKEFPKDQQPFNNSPRCLDSMWRDDIVNGQQVVNITEGETDCISGFDSGIEGAWIALPNATVWRKHWLDCLEGKQVVIWPDNDKAGAACAERIIEPIKQVALSVDVKQKAWA